MAHSVLLSVITPLYNEEENVLVFYDQICKVLAPLPYRFEIIFVDDGSRDGSAERMYSLHRRGNVTPRPLRFARNFGKEAAVSAGLDACEGEAAVILDVDLQHPVELIPEFIRRWESGADVVIGVRSESGKDSWLKDMGSRLFYRIINSISETEIIPHSTDYRLLDRTVIDQFKRFSERHRITRGLIDWLGFTRETIEFEANERLHGEASYSYKKLFNLAISSFIAHSVFPLRLVGWFGIVLMAVSGLLGLFVAVEQFLLADPLNLAVSGTAIVTLVVLFVCGVMLMSLGLISLYIGMMHGESLGRPLYVLRSGGRRGK